MKVRAVFARAISLVGGPAELYRGGMGAGVSLTVSVQPAGRPDAPRQTWLGASQEGRWLMHAPAGGPADGMDRGDVVVYAGRSWQVLEVQPVLLEGETVYHRAAVLPQEAAG